MNKDLMITLKTGLTFCALVVWRLRQQDNSSSNAISMILPNIIYELCEADVNLNVFYEQLLNILLHGSSISNIQKSQTH